MAIALVGSLSAWAGANADGFTSGSTDTTGANFIIVSYTAGTTTSETLTDSKSNTWTAMTASVGFRQQRFYYAYNATVGTGHTFTISGTDNFPHLCIAFYSGVKSDGDPLDQQDRSDALSDTTVTAGPITPSENNCLVISGLRHQQPSATVTSTLAVMVIDEDNADFGSDKGSLAHTIQTTATSVSSVWTVSTTAVGLETTIASFKSASAPAATSQPGFRRRIAPPLMRQRRR